MVLSVVSSTRQRKVKWHTLPSSHSRKRILAPLCCQKPRPCWTNTRIPLLHARVRGQQVHKNIFSIASIASLAALASLASFASLAYVA
jgi:hypothetical protein